MLFIPYIIEFFYGANVPNDNDNSGWGGCFATRRLPPAQMPPGLEAEFNISDDTVE
jgi:hypothetical protein